MEDLESQLAISCSLARLPVVELGCVQLSCCPRGPHRNPQSRMLQGQKVAALCKRTSVPRCLGQHPQNSLNKRSPPAAYMEPPALHSGFFGVGRYSVAPKSVLPAKYTRAMMAQNLWIKLINVSFDLRNTPQSVPDTAWS